MHNNLEPKLRLGLKISKFNLTKIRETLTVMIIGRYLSSLWFPNVDTILTILGALSGGKPISCLDAILESRVARHHNLISKIPFPDPSSPKNP